MTKTIIKTVLAAAAAVLTLASCTVFEPQAPSTYRVTLMYAAAKSNLFSSISQDLEEFCTGSLPTKKSGDVFLVYSHMPGVNPKTNRVEYDYPTSPVLFRAWRDPDGTYRRDTLITYPDTYISSTPEVMSEVLLDVKELFPAPHYGVVISSHGKGWIPVGYKESSPSIFSATPPTRELCIELINGSGINVNLLKEAIPYKLDYLVLDACLMGNIETAYEVRGLCDLLIVSPTEILSDGLMYNTIGALLTNVHTPDLKGVASEYFEHYNSMSGSFRSASITLMDCNNMKPLAEVCRKLVAKYRDAIDNTPSEKVKRYFYNELHWFYDLRDIFVQAGINEEELAELNAALDKTIIYARHTDSFFALKMEDMCGLAMYKPDPNLDELNEFYKTLAWNQATGLIQ